MSKGRYALNLVPQKWTGRSILNTFRHFGQRAPGKLPAARVDDLISQRFGLLILDQPCVWKYERDVLRHGYRREPQFKMDAQCDFCQTPGSDLFGYYAVEKFGKLRFADEHRRARALVTPYRFPRDHRDFARRTA